MIATSVACGVSGGEETIGVLTPQNGILPIATEQRLEICSREPECHRVYGSTRSNGAERLTWLTMEQHRAGIGPWLEGRQIYSDASGGYRVVTGLAVNADEKELSIQVRKDRESRLMRIHFADDVASAVHGGRFGPIHTQLTGQQWIILDSGARVRRVDTDEEIVLDHPVPNLNVKLLVTSMRESSGPLGDEAVDDDLFVAAESAGVILGRCRVPGSTSRAPFARLATRESHTVDLICLVEATPDEVRALEPLQLVHTEYGWILPVAPLPRQK